MTPAAILILALALAMDAFAVALVTGLRMRCNAAQTLRMALAFGGFQALMPLAGWFLGLTVRSHIEAFDHWIAFGLLGFVGFRMLKEAWEGHPPEDCSDPTRGMTLLMLAIATSLDALAVGGSLSLLNIDILTPALVIGAVCFAMTAIGLHLGRLVVRASTRLDRWANALGGLVLIGIGVRILFEHGVFDTII
ncbi:manganese efflux pump [Phaeovibrio sulfidiphilus]|uniref:Putative manganese efflux pump MntP n=1 Tax=Phaeovibrio sulfidiphilus TaxID=1220600 RepID=A0A8J6YMR8_9PROT|nr:manganese efflux pump MntP family protein [Phaeovibrio sulfidiphilus]MBE1236744.1 manganese efflux pump [Phaeovibrio sulfidiphilus]